jgi:NADPH2:quinone reductase
MTTNPDFDLATRQELRFHGKAWRASSYGAPKTVLRLQDAEWPFPAAGQVLVRVRASAIGLPELMLTTGTMPGAVLPATPGQEVCGDVVAASADSGFEVGDRVMGLTSYLAGSGGFADYAYLNATKTLPVPEPMTDEQAAGFTVGFWTAYASLVYRAAIKPGEVLLGLGASGGTGAAAVQLGRALGARVIAVAGSEQKLAFCAEHGAHELINHQLHDVAGKTLELTDGRGADAIIDPVGGPLATASATALGRLGRFLIVGFASGSLVNVEPMELLSRNISAMGVFAGGFTAVEEAGAYSALIAMATDGVITTPVGPRYMLDEVPSALTELADNQIPGKRIVLH